MTRKKRPRELTKENIAALQARGRRAAADGLLGFELDKQLKAEKLSPAEHRIVRTAFNSALENHSTKKKSPAQLDREIAATLKGACRCCDGVKHRDRRRSDHASHATMKSAVPGIAKWNTYAGGTGAAEGKHSYDLFVPEGQYTISPYTRSGGRHAGYLLKFAATGSRPRGTHGGLWHDLGSHRSPQAAASAATKHYTRGFE